MNERIKQLADEAEIYVDRFHADDAKELYWIKYKEKFFKLIVQECVKIAEQYGTPDGFRIVDEINRVMLNIRPKFGVEE